MMANKYVMIIYDETTFLLVKSPRAILFLRQISTCTVCTTVV